jgi:hypothetical protein
LECSFSPNRFHLEARWRALFDYLVEKGACLPEKRDLLLLYPGVENAIGFTGGAMEPLASASQHFDDLISSVMVRFISHIKIVYHPSRSLEAKAYPAVRLFKNTTAPFE